MSKKVNKQSHQKEKKSSPQKAKNPDQSKEEEYRKYFRQIDKDNDGFISGPEITELFRAAGYMPTEEDMNNTLLTLDSDKNGFVDFEEFLNLMKTTEMSNDPKVQSAELLKAFKMFDMNGDGVIDKNEFKMIMKQGNDPVDADLEVVWEAADRWCAAV